jgi:hypothetical protein
MTQPNASVTAASPCLPARFHIWYNVPHDRQLAARWQGEEAIASVSGGQAIRNVIAY